MNGSCYSHFLLCDLDSVFEYRNWIQNYRITPHKKMARINSNNKSAACRCVCTYRLWRGTEQLQRKWIMPIKKYMYLYKRYASVLVLWTPACSKIPRSYDALFGHLLCFVMNQQDRFARISLQLHGEENISLNFVKCDSSASCAQSSQTNRHPLDLPVVHSLPEQSFPS